MRSPTETTTKVGLTIGQFAKRGEVSVETVKYYQRNGLLRVPKGKIGGRLYAQEDLDKLHFIRRAKTLNFTLREIKNLADTLAADGATCAEYERLLVDKCRFVENEIIRLENAFRSLVTTAVNSCDGVHLQAHCNKKIDINSALKSF